MKVLTNINLSGQVLENARLNPLAAAPATFAAGEVYYDTVLSVLRVGNGTAYDTLIKSVAGTGPVSVDSSVAGVATISVAAADGSNSGLLTAAGFTLLNNATAGVTGDTIAVRDATGALSVATPTAADHAATKSYVDGLVASGMSIVGSLDATTNPDYPVAGTPGEAYKMVGSGFIGGASGEAVTDGDVILALNANAGGDQATVGSDWLVLQSNIDQATTTVAGYVTLGNLGDYVVDLGNGPELDMAAVSAETSKVTSVSMAAQLASFMDVAIYNYVDTQIANVNAGISGLVHNEVMDELLLTADIDHNLDQATQVEVYYYGSGETVLTEVTRPTTNRVTVTHAVAPGGDLLVTVTAAGTKAAAPLG